MRGRYAILLVLLMVGSANAQVASWDDPQDDQTIIYRALDDDGTEQEVQNHPGWYPQVDLLRAGILEEMTDALVFEVRVNSDSYEGTEPDDVRAYGYIIHFHFHEEAMRLHLESKTYGADPPVASLQRLEGTYWQPIATFIADTHPEGPGWTVTVPKLQLRDSQLIPAREGDRLTSIWVESGHSWYDWGGTTVPNPPQSLFYIGGCYSPDIERNGFGVECGFRPRDTMGSDSNPLGDYTLIESPEGIGSVFIDVERPFRASNGLATTYVYSLKLFNLDDAPDTLILSAADVPDGWDIYLPSRVDMDAGEIKDIRMAVSVPFGHKHGESASADILAKSTNNPTSTATTPLTVFWPEIAQPSGHHPFLYFHSAERQAWMNTAQEDPHSEVTAISGGTRTSIFGTDDDGGPTIMHQRMGWSFPLRPGLFTGLDFQDSGTITGNLEIAIRQSSEATLTARMLLLHENQEPFEIASQEQQVTFAAGETRSIPISMPLDPSVDRYPFHPEAAASLHFLVDVEAPNADPTDAPGVLVGPIIGLDGMPGQGALYTTNSFLNLPLLDYHDDVDPGLLDALTRLQLEAPEEVVRPVNPGKTAAYFFEIINKGQEADVVEWTIEGPLAKWASVAPTRTDVQPDGRSTVAIRVDVPMDAINKEVADLLLVGQSTKDPEAQVFGKFQAYVETEADIPDESDRFAELQGTAEETEAKGAPFPTVAVVIGAVLIACARRRS